MEGFSVEVDRCLLLHEILRSSLMQFMEAAGAMLLWVQKGPCNPQQKQCCVSFSFQWKLHSESLRAQIYKADGWRYAVPSVV